MPLPITSFKRELLTEVNVAPAQLHPNSWAFIKAFGILFNYFGCYPPMDVFLHFFEALGRICGLDSAALPGG